MKTWRVLVAMLGVALPCVAVPIEVKVAPSADAVVRSMGPTHNYGLGGAVAVSGSAAVNSDGQQMGLLDSFLRFNLAAFVAQMDTQFGGPDWAIQTATLRLYEQTRPNNAIYNRGQGEFEVRWIVADSWKEGTGQPKSPTTDGVCFSDESALLGTLDRSLGTFANYGPQDPNDFEDIFCGLTLDPDFLADIRAGGDVSLFLTAASASIGFQAGSKDQKDAAQRPYLALVADRAAVVPEPVTAALIALGLLGVARLGRRRA